MVRVYYNSVMNEHETQIQTIREYMLVSVTNYNKHSIIVYYVYVLV